MKQKAIFLIIGSILGILLFGFIRFFTIHEHHTHFHANFAIFINGNRVNLTDNKYMEEISSCLETKEIQPKQRAHLHENNQDTLHVHHEGVTWGHFLMNIGFNVGTDYLVDDKGVIYKSDDKNKLTFILNGSQVRSIGNELIKSEDRLLINYGSETAETLQDAQFKTVAENAHEFNLKNDPAACSGHGELGFIERLKKAFGGGE